MPTDRDTKKKMGLLPALITFAVVAAFGVAVPAQAFSPAGDCEQPERVRHHTFDWWDDYYLEEPMIIEVQECDWGDASVIDIAAVLHNVAKHINEHLREPFTGHIRVIQIPQDNLPPMTHIRSTPGQGPITVQLAVRDSYWAQFAFQFAHEFCHVLTGHERLWGSQNMWFHEAVCELASVFGLHRMGETWQTSPPYPNWASYASSLTEYADARLKEDRRQLPESDLLGEWLGHREDYLRQSANTSGERISDYARDQYSVVAYRLLPLFETHPAAWNAVQKLPDSNAPLKKYLIDWYRGVDPEDRAYVGCIMEEFSMMPED